MRIDLSQSRCANREGLFLFRLLKWDLDMVTRYERILLRLRTFTEENHSAQQESFAGSLRREMAAILRASAIVG